MATEVRISPNRGTNIERALRDKMEITIRREAARVAELAVQEGQRIAREDLYTDRPANRRRSPGTARYVNGFTAKVESNSFPFVIVLRNRSPIANIIENGQSGGTRTRPEGSKPWSIPQPPGAHSNAYGGNSVKKTRTVTRGSVKGYKILERAVKSALQKRGAALRATK